MLGRIACSDMDVDAPVRTGVGAGLSRRWPLVLVAAICMAVSPTAALAQQAKVQLRSSSASVGVGEQFRLEARVDVEAGELDDFSVPSLDAFEVLSQGESRPFSFSFGLGQGSTTRSSVVRTYVLRALDPGTVELAPAVAVVDGRRFASQALTIRVVDSAGNVPSTAVPSVGATTPGGPPAADDDPVDPATVDARLFLRTVVDRDDPYVGEQVTVTVYLYSRNRLRSTPTVTQEPATDGFWTQDLLPSNRALAPTQQRVEGRLYNVYVMRRFAAFPLAPGARQIGPMQLQVGGGQSMFDLFAGGGARKTLKRRSEAVSIGIKDVPEQLQKASLSHVGKLALSFQADRNSIETGEAFTLKATLTGEGNLKGIRLPNPVAAGLEVLEPKVSDNVTVGAGRVGGTRTVEWLVLAREPGTHALAAPVIATFDPATAKSGDVSAPALTVRVHGAPTASPAAGTGTGGAQQTGATDNRAAVTLGVPRQSARLGEQTVPLHARPGYVWSLAFAPLALLLLVALRTAARWRARQGTKGPQQAARDACSEAMREASAHAKASESAACRAALERAIRFGLEAELGESVGAMTFDAMGEHLEAAGAPAPIARRVVQMLREHEAARFVAGSDSGSALQEALVQTTALLKQLSHAAGGESP